MISYIFKSAKKNNTIIFFNKGNYEKIKTLKKKGIILIKSDLNKNKVFDLKVILKKLYILGTRNLLIEGGDKLTKSLIKERLVDNFYLFQSQKKISKIRPYKNFSSLEILNKKYMKKFANNLRMVKDTITIYKKKNV